MSESSMPANVGSMEGLGLEPAAHVRWHAQNGFDVTEFSGLREHPEVEAFWDNRTKLALYTADQVRAAVAAERDRCAKLCAAKFDEMSRKNSGNHTEYQNGCIDAWDMAERLILGA